MDCLTKYGQSTDQMQTYLNTSEEVILTEAWHQKMGSGQHPSESPLSHIGHPQVTWCNNCTLVWCYDAKLQNPKSPFNTLYWPCFFIEFPTISSTIPTQFKRLHTRTPPLATPEVNVDSECNNLWNIYILPWNTATKLKQRMLHPNLTRKLRCWLIKGV